MATAGKSPTVLMFNASICSLQMGAFFVSAKDAKNPNPSPTGEIWFG